MMNADRVPADNKVNIFGHWISFVGFTASLETAIQIAIDANAMIPITSLDTVNISFLYIVNF